MFLLFLSLTVGYSITCNQRRADGYRTLRKPGAVPAGKQQWTLRKDLPPLPTLRTVCKTWGVKSPHLSGSRAENSGESHKVKKMFREEV